MKKEIFVRIGILSLILTFVILGIRVNETEAQKLDYQDEMHLGIAAYEAYLYDIAIDHLSKAKEWAPIAYDSELAYRRALCTYEKLSDRVDRGTKDEILKYLDSIKSDCILASYNKEYESLSYYLLGAAYYKGYMFCGLHPQSAWDVHPDMSIPLMEPRMLMKAENYFSEAQSLNKTGTPYKFYREKPFSGYTKERTMSSQDLQKLLYGYLNELLAKYPGSNDVKEVKNKLSSMKWY